MAIVSSILAASIAAAGAIAGGVVAAANKPKQTPAPTYNAEKEKQKAANQEAEANKRRVMNETETVKTSALGNVGETQTQKKTLLGG